MSILKTCPVSIYGDTTFRGKCPTESFEQVSFFNWIRTTYPDSYGRLAVHIRNEDGRASGRQVNRMKLEGLTKGAPDIIIPGCPSLLIELKRKDPTQSSISKEQIEYLRTAEHEGSMVVLALGAEAARQAVMAWEKVVDRLLH